MFVNLVPHILKRRLVETKRCVDTEKHDELIGKLKAGWGFVQW